MKIFEIKLKVEFILKKYLLKFNLLYKFFNMKY